MLYGLNIHVDYWGISSKEVREEYPEVWNGQGKLYFKTKRERDNYIKDFDISIWNKYKPGYDCDNNLEITDYGSFSITITYDTWTEKFKEIRMR